MVQYDRVLGGFLGVALGDALGIPHEFRGSGDRHYSGLLQYETTIHRRFQEPITLSIGRISDDTEMSIALARCLVSEQRQWSRPKVAAAYMDWANSRMPLLGRLTRALFKGVKTFRGWTARYNKTFNTANFVDFTTEGLAAQSNGSLMRAFPLCCIAEGEVEDAMMSNPNPVNVACNSLYVGALRLAIRGVTPAEIWEYIVSRRQEHPNINLVITAVEASEDWPMRDTPELRQKGWVINSFFAAMSCLFRLRHGYNERSYPECIHWVIGNHPGSDTDTNAAIAGGLIGAIIGFEMMNRNEVTRTNFMLVRTQVSDRPPQYKLDDIEDLCRSLIADRAGLTIE